MRGPAGRLRRLAVACAALPLLVGCVPTGTVTITADDVAHVDLLVWPTAAEVDYSTDNCVRDPAFPDLTFELSTQQTSAGRAACHVYGSVPLSAVGQRGFDAGRVGDRYVLRAGRNPLWDDSDPNSAAEPGGLSITLPGPILEHDAFGAIQGNSVAWSRADAGPGQRLFVVGSVPNTTPVPAMVLAAGGGIALGASGMFLVLAFRRRLTARARASFAPGGSGVESAS